MDNTKQDFERYCIQRKNYKGKCLCVFEVSTVVEKEHVHIIMEDERSYSAFRDELLKRFPRVDKQYSLKPLPIEKIQDTEQYLCKSKNRDTQPEVLYKSDHYPEEIIKDLHTLYWDVNDSLRLVSITRNSNILPASDSVPDRVRPVKQQKKKFLAQVAERCQMYYPKDYVWNIKNDAKYWHDTLIAMHGAQFMPYNAHQIDKELNCLAAYFCPEEMVHESTRQLHEFHLPWSEWLR